MKFLELETSATQTFDDSTLKHYSKQQIIISPIRWSITLYICNLILNYTVGIKTASKTSHQFPLEITPMGLFFSIWGLIFRNNILFTYPLNSIHSHCCHLELSIFTLGSQDSLLLLDLQYLHVYMGHLLDSTICSHYQHMFITLICHCLGNFQEFLTFFIKSLLQMWKSTAESAQQGRVIKWKYNAMSNLFLSIINQGQTVAFQLGWVSCASLLNFGIFLVYGPFTITQQSYSFLFWALFIGLQLYIFIEVWKSSGKSKSAILSTFSAFYLSTLWAVVGIMLSLTKE